MAECTHKRRESKGKLVRPSKETAIDEKGHGCPVKIAEPGFAAEVDEEFAEFRREKLDEDLAVFPQERFDEDLTPRGSVVQGEPEEKIHEKEREGLSHEEAAVDSGREEEGEE